MTKSFKLPEIKYWDDELCDILNNKDFNLMFDFNENDKDLIEVQGEGVEDIKKQIAKLNSNRECSIYRIDKPNGCKNISFVRFGWKIVLFDEINDELKNKVLDSINENASILVDFRDITKDYFEDEDIRKYEDLKDKLKCIRQLRALSSYFNQDKRPENGIDNNLWYELLQNVNDHIDSDDKVLSITINDEKLELKYKEKNGFRIKDFMAICTSGNSGNIESNDKNQEGKKGTGFKSVYNLFKKVEINTRDIKCILNDEDVQVKLNINKKKEPCEIIYESTEPNCKSKDNYPIPIFSSREDKNDIEYNVLTFYFKSTDENCKLKEKIFGSKEEIDKNGYKRCFIDRNDYLFLDNIKEFSFNIDLESFIFDKEEHIKESYYKLEKPINIEENNIKNYNCYWDNRINSLKFEQKCKIKFLFPKNISVEDHNKERKIYCTLPIEEMKYYLPFFINIPLLELNDARTNINNEIMKDWNRIILEKALWGYEENGIQKSAFSEIYDDVIKNDITSNEVMNLTNCYLYFPYKYMLSSLPWTELLKKIPFIQTLYFNEKNEKVICGKSFIDLENNDAFFLNFNMYWWFANGLDKINNYNTDKLDKCFVWYDSIKDIIDYSEDNKQYEICDNKILKYIIGIKNRFDIQYAYATMFEYIEKSFKTDSHSFERDKGLDLFKRLNYELEENRLNFKLEEYNKYKSILYKAYFDIKGINFNDKTYQCILNRDLYNDGIDLEQCGYINLKPIIEESYKDLDEKISYSEIKDIIKNLYNINLIESIYLEFIQDGGNKARLRNVKSIKELVENIKKSYNEEECYEQIVYKSTNELFKILRNENEEFSESYGPFYLSKSYINNMIENGLIYSKNVFDRIIMVTNTTYVTKFNIPDNYKKFDNICLIKNDDEKFFYLDNDKNVISVLPELNIESINSEEFYNKNDDLKDLQSFVIENEINGWHIGAKKAIEENYDDIDGCIKKLIFTKLVKNEKQNNEYLPIRWNECFIELINRCDIEQDDFGKQDKLKKIFKCEPGNINQLPKNLKDRFMLKVNDYEKNEVYKYLFTKDTNEYKNIGFVVDNWVYITTDGTKKGLYCFFEVENSTFLVIFGEKSFSVLLDKEFNIKSFSENKAFEEIKRYASKKSPFTSSYSENINDKDVDLAENQISIIEEEGKLINRFLDNFEIRKEDKTWIKTRGYGVDREVEDYKNCNCPICKSILLAESSLLSISHLSCTINGYKFSFTLPIILCKNCLETMKKYSDEVILKFKNVEGVIKDEFSDKEEFYNVLQLNNGDLVEMYFSFIFNKNKNHEKILPVKVTYFNRMLWKNIIKNKKIS